MTPLIPAPPAAELDRRQKLLDRLLAAEGAGHVVHDLPVRADGRAVALESRPWRVDPLPYVLTSDEFAWLAGAVAERMRAAEAILSDLYGDRRLVAGRVIEPAQMWATDRYRLAAVGHRAPHRWLTSFSVDVVRDVTGYWYAIADHTDAPTGLGYSLLDRAVYAQAVGFTDGVRPRAIEPMLVTLRRGLAELTGTDGPRIVVFSGGIDHASYVEHSYVATKLGFNLVEAADLVVRQRRVWLRTLSGLEPVDVIHRRLEDHRLDPMEVNAAGHAGIPGVLQARAEGNVAFSNAHGAGIMESDSLAGVWDAAAEYLTGFRPVLPLRAPGAAPVGTMIDGLLDAPAERMPVWRDGAAIDLPIVLRLHAVATDEGITVMPGGNGRMLGDFDDPRIPTPCIAKDVWVLGADGPPMVRAGSLPQVDLIGSVPTRAAESLFWLGRSAERAEAVARLTRVALTERDLEVGPIDELVATLLAALAGPFPRGDAEFTLPNTIDVAADRCIAEVGSILAESASVREFLSGTAGRVLGQMADGRAALQAGRRDVDTFDELLLLLSAFSGLWSESVVRGPAWHVGDLARRVERALVVLESLAAAEPVVGRSHPASDRSMATFLEILLAGHDSLVAYRRRHRSDVEWSAVLATLVDDARNPRSLAFSAERVRRDAEAIGWDTGVEALDSIRSEWSDPTEPSAYGDSAAALRKLAMQLTRERLATPPDPALVTGIRVERRHVDD